VALTFENSLHKLQTERAEWAARNFPNAGAKEHALGVCEEAGELAHAVLKMAPGLQDGGSIRGDEESLMAEAADAIGDCIIYLAGVATDLGLALDQCVEDAWNQVKQRDWENNRVDGSRS
jgi:NTP pyrophosphatase (non-canonical NTP hydrolase)